MDNTKKQRIRNSLMKAIIHILEAMVHLDIVDYTTGRDLSRILNDTIILNKKLAYVYYVKDTKQTSKRLAKEIMNAVINEQRQKKL